MHFRDINLFCWNPLDFYLVLYYYKVVYNINFRGIFMKIRPQSEKLVSMMRNIESLKGLVRRKTLVLNQLDMSKHLRLVSLVSGMAILLFCLWLHLLLRSAGSFMEVPLAQKVVFLTSILIVTVLVSFVKTYSIARGARKIDEHFKAWSVVKEFFTMPEYRHSYLLWMLALSIALPVLGFRFGVEIIIPLLGILFGVICAFIGGIYADRLYYFLGYWFLLTGLLPLVFMDFGKLASVALTWGGGFLLFGFFASFKKKEND